MLVALLPWAGWATAEQTRPVALRCEYRTDPLGIDVKTPRLQWQLQNPQHPRGLKQTAYRLLVATSKETLAQQRGDLWDSGKVSCDQSIQVQYGGKALESGQRCWWKVRVWMGGGASGPVIGTSYAAYNYQLMAEMAEAIGETEDARSFRQEADDIADAYAKVFFDAKGRIKHSSQTGYAMAFTMNLVPETLRDEMAARFSEVNQKFNYHPRTGFIGTPRLLPGLHLAGRDDDAYMILLSDRPADKAEGVKYLRMDDGCAVYEVGSGSYHFFTTKPQAKTKSSNVQ